MNKRTLKQNICDECRRRHADVLVVEESIDMYSQSTRQIVCYTCSDCASDYLEDGYKEVPVFDVDPDVVEVEQLSPGSKRFTIKKRDTDNEAWIQMQGDDMIENVEARR